jgi:glycosyltransferase involved in cell wall biosynthesis
MIDRRIKVLICINNLYVGGAQRQLQKQLPYFDTSKFDITVLSFDIDTDRENIDINFPDKISHQQIKMKSLKDVRGWYRIFGFTRRLRPDVIMTSMFWSNTIGRVLGLWYRIPVIARYHNTVCYPSAIHKYTDIFLARYTRAFVGVSSEVARFVVKEIPSIKDSMIVIPNGIDLVNISNRKSSKDKSIRHRLGVDDDEILLLSAGRLVVQKNHELMVQGFSLIRKKYHTVKLCLVGDGACEDDLKKMAGELGLTDVIHFMGYQDNVHPFYEAADVYISTSKIEGMSNTQLEALAHGIPVISTQTGGVTELIDDGNNGFIIDSSPDSILLAFERYLHSDKLSLQKNAQDRVRRFDIRKTVKMYEELWEKTVN